MERLSKLAGHFTSNSLSSTKKHTLTVTDSRNGIGYYINIIEAFKRKNIRAYFEA